MAANRRDRRADIRRRHQGLDMPFNIHWVGAKAHGTFDPTTKAFTAGEAAEYLATYSIAGTASARIAGAVVVVAGQTLISDANGMAGILLPAGSHPYTITATGYTVSTGHDRHHQLGGLQGNNADHIRPRTMTSPPGIKARRAKN